MTARFSEIFKKYDIQLAHAGADIDFFSSDSEFEEAKDYWFDRRLAEERQELVAKKIKDRAEYRHGRVGDCAWKGKARIPSSWGDTEDIERFVEDAFLEAAAAALPEEIFGHPSLSDEDGSVAPCGSSNPISFGTLGIPKRTYQEVFTDARGVTNYAAPISMRRFWQDAWGTPDHQARGRVSRHMSRKAA